MKRLAIKLYYPFIFLSKILSRKNIYKFLDSEFSKIRAGAVVANIGSGGKIEDSLRHWAKQTGFVVHSMDIDHGFLCRPRDASDLADKMERMICMSQTEREAMGLRGREKVVREFDEKIVIDKYLAAIEAVLARKNMAELPNSPK